jgi:hypothetical protein
VTASEPTVDPDYRYGSFVPEREGLDHLETRDTAKMSASKYKVRRSALKFKQITDSRFLQPITKIEEIHAMPRMAGLYKVKKRRTRNVSYIDLPESTKELFKKRVIPLSLEATGALKPWETPSDSTIIDTWNYVYDDDERIEDGDTECDRFVIAKTLVSQIHYVYHMLTFV